MINNHLAHFSKSVNDRFQKEAMAVAICDGVPFSLKRSQRLSSQGKGLFEIRLPVMVKTAISTVAAAMRLKSMGDAIMLTITPEACQYIRDQGGIIYLEYFSLKGCCIPYQPGPAVRFGQPHDPEQYRLETIDGMTVFVPFGLPDIPLQINLNTFVGFKRLVVEGWRHA